MTSVAFGSLAASAATPRHPSCTASASGTVTGTRSDDVVCGRNGGRDRLYGYGGNDVLDGRAGADRMSGGVGNDYYYVDDAADQVVEKAGAGYDTVRLESSNLYTIPSGVERLRGLDAHVEVYGSASGDIILGSDVGDIISGREGSDTIDGRGGDDHIYEDGWVAAESGDDHLSGGDGDDHLDGRFGADVLSGGPGDDELVGGGDDDVLTGGPGADTFRMLRPPGNDTITDFTSGTDKISVYEAADWETFRYVGGGPLMQGWASVQVLQTPTHTTLNVDVDRDGVIAPSFVGDYVITMPPGTRVSESDLVLARPTS